MGWGVQIGYPSLNGVGEYKKGNLCKYGMAGYKIGNLSKNGWGGGGQNRKPVQKRGGGVQIKPRQK